MVEDGHGNGIGQLVLTIDFTGISNKINSNFKNFFNMIIKFEKILTVPLQSHERGKVEPTGRGGKRDALACSDGIRGEIREPFDEGPPNHRMGEVLANFSFRTVQTSGKNTAPAKRRASPASDMRIIMTLTLLKVSIGVIPVMRPISQKPLSFAQEIGFEPQPMASAR